MWPPLKTTFPKRAWQATLAGTADDPGGARGRPGADGRQRTPEDRRGRSSPDLAGAQLWHSKMWHPLKTTWQNVAPTKNHMAFRCGPHETPHGKMWPPLKAACQDVAPSKKVQAKPGKTRNRSRILPR